MTEAAFREGVIARQEDYSTYALPELDALECDEFFERIREAERVVCPDDTKEAYQVGAAGEADELVVVRGRHPVLLTAEHATDRLRHFHDARGDRPDAADQGTFGLSWVARNETDASLVAAVGRQTGDANYDVEHPLKEAMLPIIANPGTVAHLSVHRMFRGRVAAPEDDQAFNVVLGIGDQPSDATKDFVDKALLIAKTYDLRTGVNQAVVQFEKDKHTPKRKSDGNIQTITLAAKGPGTTRTFSQAAAEAVGKPFIAAQLELSSCILLQPTEPGSRRSFERQKVGVYLGYLFLRECLDAANIRI